MGNKVIIKLGQKEFEVEPDFKLACALTKYRNKARFKTKVDITDDNKAAFVEIANYYKDIQEGKERKFEEISGSALNLIVDAQQNPSEIFEYEELMDIGKKLTNITNDAELETVFSEAMAEIGYDQLVEVLIEGMNSVFMNANAGSPEKAQ